MKRIPFEDEHQDDEHFGVNGLDHSMYEDEESKRKKKKKKHKKDKKKQAELNGLAGTPPEPSALSFADSPTGWYNAQEAKGNLGNAAMKGLIDVGVAAIGSSYLAAALGKYAAYVGAAITIAGHYMDKTGIIRTLGAGIVAHAVAKSSEYNSETSSVLGRIMGVKDDLLRAFLLKKYKDENGVSGLDDPEGEALAELVEIKVKEREDKTPDWEENPIEGLDTSELDDYDNYLAREAQRFAAEMNLQGHDFGNDDEETEDDLQGYEDEAELQGHLEAWQRPQYVNPSDSHFDSDDPGELGYSEEIEADY